MMLLAAARNVCLWHIAALNAPLTHTAASGIVHALCRVSPRATPRLTSPGLAATQHCTP